MDSTARDLFTDGLPPLPRTAVPCEYEQCVGCTEMYRALADEPRTTRPLELFTLEQYAEEVQEFRRQRAWNEKVERLPILGKRLRHDIDTAAFRKEMAGIEEIAPPISVNGNHEPLPDAAVFGRPDQCELEARSRDRISITGWAASRSTGAPIEEVRLDVASERVAVIRDFFYRPDIATTYGRPDMVKCGWRAMVYLPDLAHGEYDLVPQAIDREGNAANLTPIRIRIVD